MRSIPGTTEHFMTSLAFRRLKLRATCPSCRLSGAPATISPWRRLRAVRQAHKDLDGSLCSGELQGVLGGRQARLQHREGTDSRGHKPPGPFTLPRVTASAHHTSQAPGGSFQSKFHFLCILNFSTTEVLCTHQYLGLLF